MDPTASDSSRTTTPTASAKTAASSLKVHFHTAVSDVRFTLQVTDNSSNTVPVVASTCCWR